MTHANLKAHFDHVDSDGNGRIDRNEFERLVARLGLRRSDNVVDLAFTSIDTDENGTIDFQEFRAWLEKAAPGEQDKGFEVPPHAH
jgi:calmodulin